MIIRLQSTLPAGEFDCHGGEEEEEDVDDNKEEDEEETEDDNNEDANKEEETQPPFACSLIGFCWRGYNRRVPDVISSLFFVPLSKSYRPTFLRALCSQTRFLLNVSQILYSLLKVDSRLEEHVS